MEAIEDNQFVIVSVHVCVCMCRRESACMCCG